MKLSLREAATILRLPPRTVRGQLQRGDLPGRKVGNRWVVRLTDLPLDDNHRRAAGEKLMRLRGVVEDAVPEALKSKLGAIELAALDVFRLGRGVLVEMRDHAEAVADADAEVEHALLAVAEGHHQFTRAAKLDAFERARRRFSHAIARLLIHTFDGEAAPRRWAEALEQTVLPRLAGLIRWAEGLPDPARRS